MTLCFQRRGGRGAYTLMELLIVIIILMTLVAITLPIAKKVMEDSGPREASRQLAAMFALARVKAANTGRPWGVWMDCDVPVGIQANVAPPLRQATKFYLAEVPQLYSGDFQDSRVIADINLVTNPQGPWPLNWGRANGTFTIDDQSGVIGTLYTLLTGLSPGVAGTKRTEFFIRFNAEGPFFRGYVGPSAGPFYIYGKAGNDGVWGGIGDDDGVNGADDMGEYLFSASDDIRPPFPQTGRNGASFQIVRQAERVGNVLELSSGSCLDLAYSGMGNSGIEFSGIDAGYDYNPGNPVLLPGNTGNTTNPANFYNSIVVMFFPGGGVESIYLHQRPGSPLSRRFGQKSASGTLHFLIGKVDKLNFPIDTLTEATPKFILNMFNPETSNLADPTSLWISIGRMNGAITTSENMPPGLVGNPSGTQLTFQDATPTGVALPNIRIDVNEKLYFNGNEYGRPKYLEMCRTAAAGQQQIGGR